MAGNLYWLAGSLREGETIIGFLLLLLLLLSKGTHKSVITSFCKYSPGPIKKGNLTAQGNFYKPNNGKSAENMGSD